MKRLFFALFALFIMSAPMRVWGATYYNCGTNVSATLSNGVLTITGTGAMTDYVHMNSPWYASRTSIKTVVIEDGVEKIGNYAFDDCNNLTSITIPASVTHSGNNAYKGCTSLKEVRAASPDAWASITFDTNTGGRYALPFYESTGGTNGAPSADCKFYFGNSTTAASNITFTPNLTEIKPYAFYRAGSIENVYLPASVTNVGAYAFDCNITRLTINRTTPAKTEDNSFVFKSGDTYLYLPQNAAAGYANSPWYKGTRETGNGARWRGYSQDTKKISSNVPVSGRFVYPTSGTIGGITWSLSEQGVLSFTGTGELPTFDATYDSESCIPWYRFRYLVHKAVIGEAESQQQISSIKNALKWCYALTSIDIQQSSLPEVTEVPTSDFLGEVVEISVPLTDLNAEALTQEPWSNMNIHLSEPLVIDENQALNTWNGYKNLSGDAIEEVNIIRALSRSYYNTFCSPVSGEVATLLGAGAEVYAFTAVSGDAENGYTFTFSPLNGDIVAGTPYLVKPSSAITQIELTNVPTSQLTTEAQTVTKNGFSFCGVLAPTELSGEDKYVLGDGDLLYKALPGQMKGMRAYFTFPANPSGVAPRVALSFTNTPTDNAAPVADSEVKKYLYKNQMFIRSDKQTYLLQGIEKQ